MENNCCQICKKNFSADELVHTNFLRPNLLKFVKNLNHDAGSGFICLNDLRKIREMRVHQVLGKLDNLEESIKDRIVDSINEESIVTENVNKEFLENLSFGEKAADSVAKFGGSWLFIGIFVFMIAAWVLWNNYEKVAFDPFPFIFLNLFLSCIAAFQAPIIMMSQNRQAEKDRLRDNADYQINLKAELEIQQLHSKLDLFMREEWNKLLEIQKLQIEISEEIVDITTTK